MSVLSGIVGPVAGGLFTVAAETAGSAAPAFAASRMPPVPAGEFDSPVVRVALRRERDERRSRIRGHWWYPLFALLVALSGLWGLIKADQVIAQDLIWPGAGAQFVEVGPVPTDPDTTGGRIMVVVAGLNRKSGTGVAAALMPSLTAGQTRVFSLVYGSGINDQDILDKYDGLLTRYQPREISFFGSSMGGDVVLSLAAHTQSLRDDYRLNLQSAAADIVVGSSESAAPALGAEIAGGDRYPAGRADRPTPTDPGSADDADPTDDATAGDPTGDPTAGVRRPVGAQAKDVAGYFVLTDSAASAGVGSAGVGPVLTADQSPPTSPASTLDAGTEVIPPPRLGTVYLDCSPLGADDVRDSSRTQADLLTGVIEALDTEGGAVVRLTAEVLAQREQWSSGAFPFLQVRYDDLRYKFAQVMREKISGPGISTQLIKDQYGVIRRTDIEEITDALGPGTRIVYFLPENRLDDRTVRVEQVEATLLRLAADKQLNVRIVPIPGGHHASAESNSDFYRDALDHLSGTAT